MGNGHQNIGSLVGEKLGNFIFEIECKLCLIIHLFFFVLFVHFNSGHLLCVSCEYYFLFSSFLFLHYVSYAVRPVSCSG